MTLSDAIVLNEAEPKHTFVERSVWNNVPPTVKKLPWHEVFKHQ